MTLLELLIALDGCHLSRDGEYIRVQAPDWLDLESEECTPIREGFREHRRALLRLLPKAPPDTPPKVHGPGGNVVEVSFGRPGG